MSTPSPAPAPSPSLPGGPRTPEGKARSARNAVRHGLRARSFALAPDEDPAEWALHLADCARGYGPGDPHEHDLVGAIAAAIWNERRADRMLAEVMARLPGPSISGNPDASDAPAPVPSLATAIRYQTAAGMAVQRAQRTLFAYRKAALAGLIVPQPDPAEPANQNLALAAPDTYEPRHAEPHTRKCTNEFSPCTPEPEDCTPEPGACTDEPKLTRDLTDCTDEPRHRIPAPAHGTREPGPPSRPLPPAPLAALRARLDALVRAGAAASPGDRDLLAAMRALKVPDAAPYQGPIDPVLLDHVLAERQFELGGRAWLQGMAGPDHAGTEGAGDGRTG